MVLKTIDAKNLVFACCQAMYSSTRALWRTSVGYQCDAILREPHRYRNIATLTENYTNL